MFDDAFYPTPPEVVDKMLAPYLGEHDDRYGRRWFSIPFTRILEPSAGKGDICDRLVDKYHVRRENIFCIEKNGDLQHVLIGKGYKIIEMDFLSYADNYAFDLIIMNPPFDEGEDHLLKAWKVLQEGHIACLLNAETLRNPYTDKRKLLAHIVATCGKREYIGQAFKDAERPTGVEVVIVWLRKERKETNFAFDDGVPLERDGSFDEEAFSANPLAHVNIIQSLVAQYQQASALLVEMSRLQAKYEFYTDSVKPRVRLYSEEETEKQRRDKASETLNEKIDGLKKQFWDYIFDKTKIGRKTTSNFQREFQRALQVTANMAFTEANIMAVLSQFFLNYDKIIQDCIVEVFDVATSYHELNMIRSEAWKTNKSYRCAPKIIIPRGIGYDSDGLGWKIHWSDRSFYNDMDKVLCALTGRDIETVTTIYAALDHRISQLNQGRWGGNGTADLGKYSDPFDSTFFEIRIFKKGTVHLRFRSKEVLDLFNQAAARGKNWLGGGY